MVINVLLLCLCIATKHYEVDGWMPNFSTNDDLDLEKQLKVINKPPIKTIQTELGGIVDCIDINKQAAFDNPLLKNHKIQLKPSFEDTRTKAKGRHGSARYNSKIELWKDLCPKGTVPVQRTTKEDLIRANNIGTLTQDRPSSHIAEVYIRNDIVYYGIQGTLNIYNPRPVSFGQMSAAYIWVSNGTSDADFNTIQAGWQVYPDVYVDYRTHIFVSWSNSIQYTGCIDVQCAGFVQTSQHIYPGMHVPIGNTSIYDGPQFEMNFNLAQDPRTYNWWLKVEDTFVGYFPAVLFSNNLLYANDAGWTGKTISNNGHSPPMGSGHFPDGNPQHACYISRIEFKDRFRQDHKSLIEDVETHVDNPACYDVKYYDYKDDNLRHVLMFGGPGGDCGN